MFAPLEPLGIRIHGLSLGGTLQLESPVCIGNLNINGLVKVGAFTYFNGLTEATNCSIGRYCSFGPQVFIYPGGHPTHFLSTHPFCTAKKGGAENSSGLYFYEAYRDLFSDIDHSIAYPPIKTFEENIGVKIGNDVWIGMRALIMGGIEIGHGAIVGAGAVVTKDVEPYTIVAGVPAKTIRKRFSDKDCERLLSTQWWDYDLTCLNQSIDYSNISKALEIIENAISENKLPKLSAAKYIISKDSSTSNVNVTALG